ncbi:arrestin domain-containing protein 2-like [Dysidea avara]|uniref:arrestin domain-containing protein 2-like n=1 Tax=Dysidea avara TaxID=196820 RepID=UPI0033178938
MGKLKTFLVNIQGGSDQVCHSGSCVEGNVTIELSAPKIVKDIKIVLSGQASSQTEWSPSGAVTASNWESIFSNRVLHLYHAEDSSTEIPAGQHHYNFMFQLPSNIPSSFENVYGNIRYSLTATLSRPNKTVDHCCTTRITVHNLVDISTPQLTRSRSAFSDNVILCAPCCAAFSCSVSLSATIERSGYCPGNSIAINVQHTQRNTSSLSAHLRQRVCYMGRNGKTVVNTISRIGNTGFRTENGSNVKTGNLSIPINTVPSISNCRVMKVSYEVFILQTYIIRIRSLCIPVVIGNVEHLRDMHQASSVVDTQPTVDGALNSSNHHAIPSTPPPPYSRILTNPYPRLSAQNYLPNQDVQSSDEFCAPPPYSPRTTQV